MQIKILIIFLPCQPTKYKECFGFPPIMPIQLSLANRLLTHGAYAVLNSSPPNLTGIIMTTPLFQSSVSSEVELAAESAVSDGPGSESMELDNLVDVLGLVAHRS